jgi:quinohemoprotein amine dehydrogenase
MKRAGLVAVMLVGMALHSSKGPAYASKGPTRASQGATYAQAASTQKPDAPATAKPEDDKDGTPITNDVVKTVCGGCHVSDAKGRMSRISYRRTTPEGWQETIRRMVTLNKADIEPAQARTIVKYLSDQLGLAPEEAKPAAFEVERRLIDFKYTANADTERVCASCHSMGRVMLQRRTGKEWDLVVAMHRGYYPLVDFQVFRRGGPPSTEPGPDGRPPDNRHPMDKALAHLKSAFPWATTEWTAWSATMRSPRIAGTWSLSGYEPGQGPVFGTVTIENTTSSPDEFVTETRYRYARTGKEVARTGRALIYTGYQWRGRTTIGGDDKSSLREVMAVDRDWQAMSGRWFTGEHDEFGMDIQLTRQGREPRVAGVDQPSLKRGATGQSVRIFGANFPATLAPRDVDLGAGVTVTRVVSSTPSLVTVEVSLSTDAPVGARDLYVAGAIKQTALVVYEKIDTIKVSPAWNMARVGGAVFPKMFAQFEAVAYSNGADGKPDTKDDLALGAVDATWTIEEYTATFDDDDRKFVGEIDGARGLFTPALDGPNPARSGNRNNVGDVWVIATHTPKEGGAPVRARAHLVVTVPLYMRWDFFTVR